MGQKVNPTSFRLGNYLQHSSKWYADAKQYSPMILQDYRIRQLLEEKLRTAGLVKVVIERSLTAVDVVLHVAKPGVVIGRGGANLEILKKELDQLINSSKIKKDKVKVGIKVQEVKHADLSAKLVAQRIIDQLIKRFPHRRAVSQAMERVMGAGAKGVKICLSGRINGAEISRREKYFEGTVPTQSLRALIDYHEAPARTRSGYVGVKVWINKGEASE